MKQSSQTLKVAIILSFIGGFLEIYSFLTKGKVFATVITGNIVLLCYHLSNIRLEEVIRYTIPTISFLIGIYFVHIVRNKVSVSNLHWREFIIFFEILIVIFLYLLGDAKFNLLCISLISFTSAIQISSFKKIDGYVYMSTMLTGNSTKLVEALINKEYNLAKIFFCIIFSFIIGVVVGGYLVNYFYSGAILFLLVPLFMVLYLIHKNI